MEIILDAPSSPPITIPNQGLRIASMVLDHIMMVLIIAIISGLLIILPAFFIFGLNLQKGIKHDYVWLFLPLMCTPFSLYFNKDIFGARSLAKRILKMQVVNKKTGAQATPVQCVIRNFTLFLWPVEVLVTLFSPSRRIGDYIAGTRVVMYERGQLVPPRKWGNFFLALFLGILLMTTFMCIPLLLQSMKQVLK
jgi:uncharacterized RDD family membrane protein YckC